MALSADRVVEAALHLLQEYGLQDVSMRRIAATLDVKPGALYYHVPNKQQLLHLVAQRALAPLHGSAATPAELMAEFRHLQLQLRDSGDLMLIAYPLEHDLPPVPELEVSLRRQGFTPEDAAERAQLLVRSALGAIALEQNARLFGREDPTGGQLYTKTMQLLLRQDTTI